MTHVRKYHGPISTQFQPMLKRKGKKKKKLMQTSLTSCTHIETYSHGQILC